MKNTQITNYDNMVVQNSKEEHSIKTECSNVANQDELKIEKESPLDLAKKILPLADKGLSTTYKDNDLFILFINIYAFTKYKLIPEIEKINNFEVQTEELKKAGDALAEIIGYSDKGFDLTDLSEEEERSGKDFSEVHRLFGQILLITDDELRMHIPTLIENRERVYIIGCYGKECIGEIFPITGTGFEDNDPSKKENIVYWKNSKDKWVEEKRNNVGTIRTQSDLCRQPLLKQIPESTGKPQGSRVYTTDGISPCITASHGNLGAFKVRNGTKKGYDEAVPGDGINLAYPLSKTRRGRVGKGCSQTLDTNCNMGTIDNYRIRRLTPRECFRLQGFPDEMFDVAISLGLADTHLYKMAGNAVTVNVIESVVRKLAEVVNGRT